MPTKHGAWIHNGTNPQKFRLYPPTACFSRLMQFCAGPQRQIFYACGAHHKSLDNVMNFLPIDDEPIKLETTMEHVCDFCREGGE